MISSPGIFHLDEQNHDQVSEIAVTSNYGVADLRAELKDLYRKAGVKPALPLVFMLTDSQVRAGIGYCTLGHKSNARWLDRSM